MNVFLFEQTGWEHGLDVQGRQTRYWRVSARKECWQNGIRSNYNDNRRRYGYLYIYIWVVLRNCVPLGVGNFKLVFEGNLLLQCKYFYFLSLHVDVSDNKNNNDCQSCVLCTLNRTDVAKWIKNGATDLWHRQHHWKKCIKNFIKNHTVTTHLTSDDHIKCIS